MRSNRYRIIAALLVLCGLVFFALPTFADTMRAAKLSELSGDVHVLKAGGEKTMKAFKGMSLTQGDTIITGQGASATLQLDKDRDVRIAENSQVLLSELVSAIKGEKTTLQLLAGGIWGSIREQLNADSRLQVKTANAIMGVRGTEFYATQQGTTSNFYVVEGTVSLMALQPQPVGETGPGDPPVETLLSAGHWVSLDAPPEEIADFIVNELEAENLDLFALETLQQLSETNPELVSTEELQQIQQLVVQRQEERRQQAQQPPADPPRQLQYDQQQSGGSDDDDDDQPALPAVHLELEGLQEWDGRLAVGEYKLLAISATPGADLSVSRSSSGVTTYIQWGTTEDPTRRLYIGGDSIGDNYLITLRASKAGYQTAVIEIPVVVVEPAATLLAPIAVQAMTYDNNLKVGLSLSANEDTELSVEADQGIMVSITRLDDANHTPAIDIHSGSPGTYQVRVTASRGSVSVTQAFDVIVYGSPEPGSVAVASLTADGSFGNGASRNSSVSADGRFVAFVSGAENLVPGDTNDRYDVFVKDMVTGSIRLVSTPDQGQSDGDCSWATISSDGSKLAFVSNATNLVPQADSDFGVYLCDLASGTLTQIGSGCVQQPALDEHGDYVAFYSSEQLLAGDDDSRSDIYLWHDGELSLISANASGEKANSLSQDVSLSAAAEYAVFASDATNLVPDDTNGCTDVFRKSLLTGEVVLVSRTADGTAGNHNSLGAKVSADGNYVAFRSLATNFAYDDENSDVDIFLKNLETGDLALVSGTPAGLPGNAGSGFCSISADGQLVAFISSASDLVLADDNGRQDAFYFDVESGLVSMVSRSEAGVQTNSATEAVALAANGQWAVIESEATQLVAGDGNGRADVFRVGIIPELQLGLISDLTLSPVLGGSVMLTTVPYFLDEDCDIDAVAANGLVTVSVSRESASLFALVNPVAEALPGEDVITVSLERPDWRSVTQSFAVRLVEPITAVEIAGSPVSGATLTADVSLDEVFGDLLADYQYQWYRDSEPIIDGTDSTYLLTADDVDASITVSARPLGWSQPLGNWVDSEPVGPVVAEPTRLSAPSEVVWDGDEVSWSAVPAASGYSVDILRSDEQGASTWVSNQFAADCLSWDLEEWLALSDARDGGVATYQAKVAALGDGQLHLNSEATMTEVGNERSGAEPVSELVVWDAAEGDGSELVAGFDPGDSTGVQEYRLMFFDDSAHSRYSEVYVLAEANQVPREHCLVFSDGDALYDIPINAEQQITLPPFGELSDSNGQPLRPGRRYRPVLLTVADGLTATVNQMCAADCIEITSESLCIIDAVDDWSAVILTFNQGIDEAAAATLGPGDFIIEPIINGEAGDQFTVARLTVGSDYLTIHFNEDPDDDTAYFSVPEGSEGCLRVIVTESGAAKLSTAQGAHLSPQQVQTEYTDHFPPTIEDELVQNDHAVQLVVQYADSVGPTPEPLYGSTSPDTWHQQLAYVFDCQYAFGVAGENVVTSIIADADGRFSINLLDAALRDFETCIVSFTEIYDPGGMTTWMELLIEDMGDYWSGTLRVVKPS